MGTRLRCLASVMALFVGVYALSMAWARHSALQESRVRLAKGQPANAHIAVDLEGLLREYSEMQLRLASVGDSHLLGAQVVYPNGSSDQATDPIAYDRLKKAEEGLGRLRENIISGYRLLAGGSGSLADTLFSARYYTEAIRDPDATIDVRAEAFMRLSYLEWSRAFMAELNTLWTRDALAASDPLDQLRLVIAARQLPPDPLTRSILIDYAQLGDYPRIREKALRSLGTYRDEEVVWDVIAGALSDPSQRVREKARGMIAARE